MRKTRYIETLIELFFSFYVYPRNCFMLIFQWKCVIGIYFNLLMNIQQKNEKRFVLRLPKQKLNDLKLSFIGSVFFPSGHCCIV